jgi:hypothetical protein
MLRSLLFLCLTFLAVTSLWGQSTNATISGRVADQTSAAIPGAKLTVTNIDTGVKYPTETNGVGLYALNVPPGRYRIQVTKQGFAGIVKPDVRLHVQDDAGLNFEMRVGSDVESITVEGGAPLVNTLSAAVGTVVDRKFIANLPLNGRSFQSLLLLTPGVVQTSSVLDGGQFSVNGQRANANYFTIDGVGANGGISTDSAGSRFGVQAGGALPTMTALGGTNSLLSVDALEEFKVQTSTTSAEYGRQPGGQVQLVSRSGSNRFHGSAFEFLRNDAADGRRYFNREPAKKPPLRQNLFGGTFSGPIIPNKTFFFFSYEGLRLLQPTNVATRVVPSLELRAMAHPSLKPILDAYPTPTGPENKTTSGVGTGAAPYVASFSNPRNMDAISIRVDHTLSSKLTLFGRYSDSPSMSTNRQWTSLFGGVFKSRTLTLGATSALTSRLANEFRVNYSTNRARNSFIPSSYDGGVAPDLATLLSGYTGPGIKRAQVTVSGFAGLTADPITLGDSADNLQQQLNLVENLSWVKGKHLLKFGFDWRHLTPKYGPVEYDVSLTIRSVAHVVAGRVSNGSINTKQAMRPVYNNFSTFAQDTWKVTPRLTMDLGLRWEVNPAPYDANGLKPVTVAMNGTDVATLRFANADEPYYKTFLGAFAPRFGAAYLLNPASGRETVLRGGFGVYYDLGSGLGGAALGGYPWTAFKGLSSLVPHTLPLSDADKAPPAFPSAALTPAQASTMPFVALNPDLKLPYTLQWNVALQQALGQRQTATVSYVASAGRRLLTSERYNNFPRDTFFDANGIENLPRPNANFGPISRAANGPSSDYHSLQAQYQARLGGLQALASYTWSHAIDVVSNESGIDSRGVPISERGNADFDIRHVFNAAVTYDLPKLTGTGPLAAVGKAVVNNWSIDSTFYSRAGAPINPIAGGLNYVTDDGAAITIRPDVVPGQAFWIKDPNAPGGQRLNINAFQAPPSVSFAIFPDFGIFEERAVRQGNLARNLVRMPGIYQINLGVRRQFNITERANVQVKLEAFNPLNHPIFGTYDTTWIPGRAAFGAATGTLDSSLGGLTTLYQLGGARSMQMSVRFNF